MFSWLGRQLKTPWSTNWDNNSLNLSNIGQNRHNTICLDFFINLTRCIATKIVDISHGHNQIKTVFLFDTSINNKLVNSWCLVSAVYPNHRSENHKWFPSIHQVLPKKSNLYCTNISSDHRSIHYLLTISHMHFAILFHFILIRPMIFVLLIGSIIKRD